MLLIYINDDTIHEMHTGNTYRRHAGSVEIISPAQHNDANYMMPNIICADGDAETFWNWLKSQSLVPLPRMHALSSEIDAAVVEPAPVETPEFDDDGGFNPKADNGGLYRSTDVRCTDPDSVHYNRIGKVTHFYYDEEDGRGVFLAHIDVKFGKDRSVTLEPRQVIDIPF